MTEGFAAELLEIVGKCVGIGFAGGFSLVVSVMAASALIGVFRHYLGGR